MRYFIEFAYNGKNYHGFQSQPDASSVQETLEKALSTLFRESITIVGAGRTDTGVHAKQMFAHFDSELELDSDYWSHKLNSFLPQSIVILKIFQVSDEAHARFDATSRTYEYYLHTDVSTFNCKITVAHWQQKGNQLIFTITADRFLRNMVRAIVGTMVNIGLGKIEVADLHHIISSKDRGKAGFSVPAHGLYLVNVSYPYIEQHN